MNMTAALMDKVTSLGNYQTFKAADQIKNIESSHIN